VKAGDNIRYLNLSKVQGAEAQRTPAYVFVDFVRTLPIIFLAVLYAVVVIAVARWRGLRALIGLVGAYGVLVSFILPGLVEGKPPLLLALVGSTVIMIGVLYFAHGFSARTSTALRGTMFGLAITALLAAWATDAANLAGVGSHDSAALANGSDNIPISGIILCGLIISGLGVLNDVTITQSSAVWELWELAPETSARQLFASAMRIGRDHIASTVYTIAFAYAGAALPVLILVMLYERRLERREPGRRRRHHRPPSCRPRTCCCRRRRPLARGRRRPPAGGTTTSSRPPKPSKRRRRDGAGAAPPRGTDAGFPHSWRGSGRFARI
jgi:uncharacterized membrane protein